MISREVAAPLSVRQSGSGDVGAGSAGAVTNPLRVAVAATEVVLTAVQRAAPPELQSLVDSGAVSVMALLCARSQHVGLLSNSGLVLALLATQHSASRQEQVCAGAIEALMTAQHLMLNRDRQSPVIKRIAVALACLTAEEAQEQAQRRGRGGKT